MRFAASPRCVPPASCPHRRPRPAPAAQCVLPRALALTRALTRLHCARRRLPARCAAGGGGDAQKGSWPSADELRRASSFAPDAAKHFDVTGVVVAPSFRASRTFLGASTPLGGRVSPNCYAFGCTLSAPIAHRTRFAHAPCTVLRLALTRCLAHSGEGRGGGARREPRPRACAAAVGGQRLPLRAGGGHAGAAPTGARLGRRRARRVKR